MGQFYFNPYNNEDERCREELRKKKEAEKHRIEEKRKIVVKTVFDLTEKYEDYNIKVNKPLNGQTGYAILYKPIEVKYFTQFRIECQRLNLIPECDSTGITYLHRD